MLQDPRAARAPISQDHFEPWSQMTHTTTSQKPVTPLVYATLIANMGCGRRNGGCGGGAKPIAETVASGQPRIGHGASRLRAPPRPALVTVMARSRTSGAPLSSDDFGSSVEPRVSGL